jgi:serine/threonine protein kinase
MKDREVFDVDLYDLNEDTLKVLGDFFAEQEKESLGNMIFEKDHIYAFSNNREIRFNNEVIGYQRNKKNQDDKTEWAYSVRLDKGLGKGSYGEVYKIAGKLVHKPDGSMRYIATSDVKSSYNVKLMTVDSLEYKDINLLRKNSNVKTPLLIKDKNGNVYSFARYKNSCVVLELDSSKFINVTFPESHRMTDEINIDTLGQDIKNEIDLVHTRKRKVVKLSPSDKVSKENFFREANTANVMGQGAKPPTFGHKKSAIIMDKAPGMTLDKALKYYRLGFKDMLELSIALLNELNKYHEKGYMHNDIKPENIMVKYTANGLQVKIIDHGECKNMKVDEDERKHLSKGTLLYMSCEMFKSPADANEKSDVYSMGRVLKKVWGDEGMKMDLALAYDIGFYYARVEGNNPEPSTLIKGYDEYESEIHDIEKLLDGMTNPVANLRLDGQDVLEKLKELDDVLQSNKKLQYTPISNLASRSDK